MVMNHDAGPQIRVWNRKLLFYYMEVKLGHQQPIIYRGSVEMIRAINHWICSIKPPDKVPMETLYTKLGIQEVAVALRTKRLRWYGHVARAPSWTNSITSIAIPGPRGCLRPKKFWSECVKADVDVCYLEGIDPQNIEACRSGVKRTSQLQLTPGTGKLSEV